MKFLSFMRRLSRNEQGAIALFLVFAITTLIIAAATAYEMSRFTKAKARFNNAIDQALLATASAYSTDPSTYGTKYFNTNFSQELGNIKVTRLTFNSYNNNINWRAVGSATMPTVFGKFVGIKQLELGHKAEVSWGGKAEIVAMVDVSGTMCSQFKRIAQADGSTAIDIEPDPRCTKLNQMKEGLKQIIDIGVGYNGKPGTPAYKTGIIPYTFKVKVRNPAAIPPSMIAGETSGGYGNTYYTNLSDAEFSGPPLPEVVPLMDINNESDKNAFLAKVDGISTANNQEINRPFMKRSSVGAAFSALMLDPDHRAIFGGSTPDAFASNTRKIVILMTDTANLGCCFTNWPADNFRNHYVYSHTPDHEALVGAGADMDGGLCKAMKDQGIEIFTVLFDVDRRDMDARGEQIVESFKKCASEPQMAFEIPFSKDATPPKLKEAYTIIGKSIMSLQLVR